MEIAKFRFPYKGRIGTWRLIPLGDVHLGAKGCDEEAFERTVDSIAKDDHTLTILMGDMCDCIVSTDKRWDDRAVAEWCYEPWARANIAIAQRDRMLASLKRIPRERILGIIAGNHENTIRRTHQLDMTLDIARELGCPFLGEEAFIQLIFHQGITKTENGTLHGLARTFVIFVTHGSGGGRKPGGKVNKIADLSAFVEADIILCGHHHDRVGLRTVQLSLDSKGNFIHKERVNVLTGSYLKTYQLGSPSYGARELYPPTAIGSPVITIRPYDRHLEVTT